MKKKLLSVMAAALVVGLALAAGSGYSPFSPDMSAVAANLEDDGEIGVAIPIDGEGDGEGDDEGSSTASEVEYVTLKSWNFRDATAFPVDTRILRSTLTIEYDTIPSGIKLYKSTDAMWDGLVFEPAKDDNAQAWWVRSRNASQYGLAAVNQTRYFGIIDVHEGYKVTIESHAAMPLADSTMVSEIVQNASTACGQGVSYTYTIAKDGTFALYNAGVYMYQIIVEAPVLTRYVSNDWNFRDATVYPKDTRVAVASLTIEYDTIPSGVMLYKSTDAKWDGLAFQPAKNDGTQSWWVRDQKANENEKYGLGCINVTRYFAVTDLKAGSKVTVESVSAMPLADSTMVSNIEQNATTTCGYGVSYTYTMAKDGMLAFSNNWVYMYRIFVEKPVNYYETETKDFHDVSVYPEDTRVLRATLTIEYDTVPTGQMLYKSTDSIWDGLAFEPATKDDNPSWWVRNRTSKGKPAQYGLAQVNDKRYVAVIDLKAGEQVTVEAHAAMPLADSTMVSDIKQNATPAYGYGVSYTYTMAKNGMLAFYNDNVYIYSISTVRYGGQDEGVAQPTITADGADYAAKLITMEATDGATITYTLDGGEEQTYSAPFYLSKSALIAATAELNGVKSDAAYLDVTAGAVSAPTVTVINVNNLERTVVIASATAPAYLTINGDSVANNDTVKINTTTDYSVVAVYPDANVGNILSDTTTASIEAGVMVNCAGVTYAKAVDPDSLTAAQNEEAMLYYFVLKADQSSTLCTPTVKIQYTLTPLGGVASEPVIANPGDTVKNIPASTKLAAVAMAEGYANSAETHLWVKKPAELTPVWEIDFDTLAMTTLTSGNNFTCTTTTEAFANSSYTFYRIAYDAAGNMTNENFGIGAGSISSLLRYVSSSVHGYYSMCGGTRQIAFNNILAKQVIKVNAHNGQSESTSVSANENVTLDAASSSDRDYVFTATGSGVATVYLPRYWYIHKVGVYNSSEVTSDPTIKVAKCNGTRRWVGMSSITEHSDIYYRIMSEKYDSSQYIASYDTVKVAPTETADGYTRIDTIYATKVDTSLVGGDYTLYTEPFEITENTTIQAYANCMDVLSDVVTTTIEMDGQEIKLNRPVITWAGKTATFMASVDNSDVLSAPACDLYYTPAGGVETKVEDEFEIDPTQYGWMKVVAKAEGYVDSEPAWRYADARESYAEPYLSLYEASDTIPANIASMGDVEIKAGLVLDSLPATTFKPTGSIYFHVATNENYANLVSPIAINNADVESGKAAVMDGRGNVLTRNDGYTLYNLVAGTSGAPAQGSFEKNALVSEALLATDTLVRVGNITAGGNFLVKVNPALAGLDLIFKTKAASTFPIAQSTFTQPVSGWKLIANKRPVVVTTDFTVYVLNADGTAFVKSNTVAPYQTAIALDSATTAATASIVLVGHTWSFNNWSEETVKNLMAGAFENSASVSPEAGWSDVEKVKSTAPSDLSKNSCFWQVKAGEKTLTANGVEIAELKGLEFTNTADRSLAIAVNYPATSLGTYYGPQYLWLGSKNVAYFTIKNVKCGTNITIGIESHKPAEDRGVKLSVGTTELTDPDGNAVAAPKTYEKQTWAVPAGEGVVDVVVTNTNGCHLYFIDAEIGEAGGGESSIETINVEEGANSVYDLQGRKVQNVTNGQIFIINGRPAIVR